MEHLWDQVSYKIWSTYCLLIVTHSTSHQLSAKTELPTLYDATLNWKHVILESTTFNVLNVRIWRLYKSNLSLYDQLLSNITSQMKIFTILIKQNLQWVLLQLQKWLCRMIILVIQFLHSLETVSESQLLKLLICMTELYLL